MLMIVFLGRRFDSRMSIYIRGTLEEKVPTETPAFTNISRSANYATKESYDCQPQSGEGMMGHGHKHAYKQ